MEDDFAPIEQSWSVGVGRQWGQYIDIVRARLSAHTDWSVVFNWRISPPGILFLTLWLSQFYNFIKDDQSNFCPIPANAQHESHLSFCARFSIRSRCRSASQLCLLAMAMKVSSPLLRRRAALRRWLPCSTAERTLCKRFFTDPYTRSVALTCVTGGFWEVSQKTNFSKIEKKLKWTYDSSCSY